MHFTASSHLFMIIDPAAQLSLLRTFANKTDIYVIQTYYWNSVLGIDLIYLLEICMYEVFPIVVFRTKFLCVWCVRCRHCPSRQTMLPIFLQNNYETLPTSSNNIYNSISTWLLDPYLPESDFTQWLGDCWVQGWDQVAFTDKCIKVIG